MRGGCFIGQILFKMAATSSREAGLLSALNFYLAVALALYGTATLVWVWQLQTVPLSYAYPFMAATFVFVPLASRLILNEHLTPGSLIGGIVIVIGVLISAGQHKVASF